jgi:ABC-type phosphate transport system permease subunit
MNRLLFEILQDFTSFSKLVLTNEINATHNKGIKGQTLVEFMLLLFIIVFLSTFFMKLVNHNISAYWRYFVSVVVDDPTVKIKY